MPPNSSTSSSELANARRFARNAAVFLAPFAIYALAIAVIDPYAFLGETPSTTLAAAKRSVAILADPCLWKMAEFNRRPSDNILLGDSRMEAMDPEVIRRLSGETYYKLSAGGATLREITDTFWFAAARTRLRNVYIGINFNQYNAYGDRMERTSRFEALQANPLRYFVERDVAHATIRTLHCWLTGRQARPALSPMSHQEYWDYQLGTTTARFYRKFVYPERDRTELHKIAAFCRENRISFAFVIFPVHADLRRRVSDFHLDADYRLFKSDVAAMGKTFDFDVDSPATRNRDNFGDPYHFGQALGEAIARRIWPGHEQAIPIDAGLELSPQ